MIYIRVNWVHSFPDEPRVLYSEIDDERWETRKVEEFREGRLGFAAAEMSAEGTKLGEEPIPALAEIGSDPQFQPVEITRAEFEAIWQKATQQR
jgi:hypothetical protein